MVVALLLGAFSHAQTPGSAQTAVLASVHQFVDGFNKGDTKSLVEACAAQTSIIDEFPPDECAASRRTWISTQTAPTWSFLPTTPLNRRGSQ